MVSTTNLVPEIRPSLRFQARNVTATKTLPVDVSPDLTAEAVASAIASLLAMPQDTGYALREDDSASFLDGDRPIGEQIQPNARVTLTPKTHLGGAGRAALLGAA